MLVEQSHLGINIQEYLNGEKFLKTSSEFIFRAEKYKSSEKPDAKMKIFILSGPPGGGKDTFAEELMEKTNIFARPKTVTTRSCRPSEIENDPYIRMTRESFEEAQKQNLFIETNEHAGNLYGSLKSEVARVIHSGKIPILKLDPNGAKNICEILKPYNGVKTIYAYILPPNTFEIYSRLLKREIDNGKTNFDARKSTQERIRNSVIPDLGHMYEADYLLINKNSKVTDLTCDFLKELNYSTTLVPVKLGLNVNQKADSL